MKALSHVLVALFVLVLVSPAMATIEVEGDAYVNYSSKYLWRGFDLSGNENVVQAGVDVAYKNFTFSYWSNTNTNTGETDETDIIIDYTFEPCEMASVSVGNIFYALDGLEDTNEVYLSLGLNTLLSPTVTVYWDYDEADTDGLFYTFSIGHDLELAEGLTLSLGALASYNEYSDYAVGDYGDWHNYELSAGLDYAVTENISVNPFIIYSDALSNDAEDIAGLEDEVVGGITLTLAF